MNETPSLFDTAEIIKGFWNGLPYEGPQLTLKKDDPDARLPKLCVTAHAKVFVTTAPDDMAEYNRVIQNMAEGHAVKSHEQITYDDKSASYHIFLRWLDFKYVAPEETKNA